MPHAPIHSPPIPSAALQNSFAPHDHRACRRRALAAAETSCAATGARLTPIRRRVLEMIWDNHKPAGAYDLLDRLHAEGRGSTPPVIYRALDFLVENGLVHKLQSRNAYLGCAHAGAAHRAQFLICGQCGHAAEICAPGVNEALDEAAARAGFQLDVAVIELAGRCPACAEYVE